MALSVMALSLFGAPNLSKTGPLCQSLMESFRLFLNNCGSLVKSRIIEEMNGVRDAGYGMQGVQVRSGHG